MRPPDTRAVREGKRVNRFELQERGRELFLARRIRENIIYALVNAAHDLNLDPMTTTIDQLVAIEKTLEHNTRAGPVPFGDWYHVMTGFRLRQLEAWHAQVNPIERMQADIVYLEPHDTWTDGERSWWLDVQKHLGDLELPVDYNMRRRFIYDLMDRLRELDLIGESPEVVTAISVELWGSGWR